MVAFRLNVLVTSTFCRVLAVAATFLTVAACSGNENSNSTAPPVITSMTDDEYVKYFLSEVENLELSETAHPEEVLEEFPRHAEGTCEGLIGFVERGAFDPSWGQTRNAENLEKYVAGIWKSSGWIGTKDKILHSQIVQTQYRCPEMTQMLIDYRALTHLSGAK